MRTEGAHQAAEFGAIRWFVAASLLGPSIGYLSPERHDMPIDRWTVTMWDLLSLIWPTQPLGVIEYHQGRTIAALLTVSTNVVVFGLIGFTAVVSSARRWTYVVFGLLLLVGLEMLARLETGSGLARLNPWAVGLAALVYGLPVWLARPKRRDMLRPDRPN